MTIAFRPLAEVKMMLEEIRHDVSYAYDDLVFAEHTAFLIQFDDETPKKLKLFFNTEVDEQEMTKIQNKLSIASEKKKLKLKTKAGFHLNRKKTKKKFKFCFFQRINIKH